MEAHANLNVKFQGESQSFLVSDPERTTWADVEAMVKVSFDLNDIQLKYIDEDKEEVFVNSQEEYEEALKSAAKQGNQLQMTVYELNFPVEKARKQSCRSVHEIMITSKEAPVKKNGQKPLKHYSFLARTVGEEMKATQEVEEKPIQNDKNRIKEDVEDPPLWFTSYMATFREQVVKETVEKLGKEFEEKLTIWTQPQRIPESTTQIAIQIPEVHSTQSSLYDWLIACSNCSSQIVGIRYQCSVCSTYTVCEMCEAGAYVHNPTHALLKLRRPLLTSVLETCNQGKSPVNQLHSAATQTRLQKQIDKSLFKAEKQRLRAEKRQRKAEFKEIKKQLKLHKKIHLWNTAQEVEDSEMTDAKAEEFKSPVVIEPIQPCAPAMPVLSAAFVDENFPDGTPLQPGKKFIKHWRMKNTGNVKWSSDTKLIFMWGNLILAPSTKKEVEVPFLYPGQVGILSVEFVAPDSEGTYASHWRLAHKGEQFGPRVWCSIIVDPCSFSEGPEISEKVLFSSANMGKSPRKQEDASSVKEAEKQQLHMEEKIILPKATCSLTKLENMDCDRDYFIPSVDLLTAQDLLSFELLDINIVQELERVPHNTPVDMTPCMSPLPHDGPLIEKPCLGQIEEECEGTGLKALLDVTLGKTPSENPSAQEEGEEDISSTQFVCETVIRSLTLEEAPDHKPPRKSKADSLQCSFPSSQETFSYSVKSGEENTERTSLGLSNTDSRKEDMKVQVLEEQQEMGENAQSEVEENYAGDETTDAQQQSDDKDEVQSQGSSSSEDYIIILPDCFDTSRPLAESMYSSALSQPGVEQMKDIDLDVDDLEDRTPEGESRPQGHSINDILSISQTLDAVPLIPVVVSSPQLAQRQSTNAENNQVEPELLTVEENRSSIPDQREAPSGEDFESSGASETGHPKQYPRPHGGIAGGLVKGALSVAASAYKALFAGQPTIATTAGSEDQTATMMSVLFEMGFCDRQLNLRLLKKHNYNLMEVVTELIQINDNDWYSSRY
ncbi:NBR1 autophagy cargo receptor a isoform X2 [Latimeria chalumnae]|uniref:NBR1 autophagy cargo receptor a isoform X2 n=1 Tax=Latimeria chalumnae TaxID=7897 RepID=UPI0003C18A37|nr:PREDICTED: next to BRCA1 gene 1 protein isoform X2 [Latimeria chalumnae]|eukprot:XP_006010538.1 PREDICTED: next to BRCA1 gene 1 protein isoform X2 [Latimeria chalumnae]